MNDPIDTYNQSQDSNDVPICDLLAREIRKGLSDAEEKIYYAAPAWLINGNPIVTYNRRKAGVYLMPEGKFKAAEICYTDVSEINTDDLARWLEASRRIQWDYKNIIKRRGVLERLL